MKNQILILLGFSLLTSCKEKIKADRGGIDIISNVYIDASKNLENRKTFLVSRLNFSNDTILETVPEPALPEITRQRFLIMDSACYEIRSSKEQLVSEIIKTGAALSVSKKNSGAIFSNEKIQNYRNRRSLSDTVLFGKKYKRFEVNSPWNYTRFYVFPTDTILPYRIYQHAEEDYSGRIERIDSYNKKQDIFVSMQLIPRKKWDDEAASFFEFNRFAKNRK